MRKLDGDRYVRVTPHRRDNPAQRLFGFVGPKTEVVGADPPLRQHRGGFNDKEPGTREG